MEIKVYVGGGVNLTKAEIGSIHMAVNKHIVQKCFGRKSVMEDHELTIEEVPVISVDGKPFLKLIITGATFKLMRDFVKATKVLQKIALETAGFKGIKRTFVAFKEFVSSDKEFELQTDE